MDARIQAEVDWERDMAGSFSTREQFFDSLFDIADFWTDTVDEHVYRDFLERLYNRITVRHGAMLYELRDLADTVAPDREDGVGDGVAASRRPTTLRRVRDSSPAKISAQVALVGAAPAESEQLKRALEVADTHAKHVLDTLDSVGEPELKFLLPRPNDTGATPSFSVASQLTAFDTAFAQNASADEIAQACAFALERVERSADELRERCVAEQQDIARALDRQHGKRPEIEAELEATTQKLADASDRNGKIRRVIKQRYAAIQFVHREATLANAASDGDVARALLGELERHRDSICVPPGPSRNQQPSPNPEVLEAINKASAGRQANGRVRKPLLPTRATFPFDTGQSFMATVTDCENPSDIEGHLEAEHWNQMVLETKRDMQETEERFNRIVHTHKIEEIRHVWRMEQRELGVAHRRALEIHARKRHKVENQLARKQQLEIMRPTELVAADVVKLMQRRDALIEAGSKIDEFQQFQLAHLDEQFERATLLRHEHDRRTLEQAARVLMQSPPHLMHFDTLDHRESHKLAVALDSPDKIAGALAQRRLSDASNDAADSGNLETLQPAADRSVNEPSVPSVSFTTRAPKSLETAHNLMQPLLGGGTPFPADLGVDGKQCGGNRGAEHRAQKTAKREVQIAPQVATPMDSTNANQDDFADLYSSARLSSFKTHKNSPLYAASTARNRTTPRVFGTQCQGSAHHPLTPYYTCRRTSRLPPSVDDISRVSSLSGLSAGVFETCQPDGQGPLGLVEGSAIEHIAAHTSRSTMLTLSNQLLVHKRERKGESNVKERTLPLPPHSHEHESMPSALDRMMNDPVSSDIDAGDGAPHPEQGHAGLECVASATPLSSIKRDSTRPMQSSDTPERAGDAFWKAKFRHQARLRAMWNWSKPSQGTTTAEREDERTNTIQPKLTPRPPILSRSSRASTKRKVQRLVRLSQPCEPEPERVVLRFPVVDRLPSSESTRAHGEDDNDDATQAQDDTKEEDAAIADGARNERVVANDGVQASSFGADPAPEMEQVTKEHATEVSEVEAADASDDGVRTSEAASSAPEPKPNSSEQVGETANFTHDEGVGVLSARPTAPSCEETRKEEAVTALSGIPRHVRVRRFGTGNLINALLG